MIFDRGDIEFLRDVANAQPLALIEQDFGNEGVSKLKSLTNAITRIYESLNHYQFNEIVAFISLDESRILESDDTLQPVVFNSTSNLSQLSGNKITIEITESSQVYIVVNFIPDFSDLRQKAVLYHKSRDSEAFYGKTEKKTLRSIPNSSSYFSIQTYKNLDVALEDYRVRWGRVSRGRYLSEIWHDDAKIFLIAGPENKMRDSLVEFLDIRLRDAEVRPEQNVDTSHPVDIKITWNLSNHLALIEVKWLGRSVDETGTKITQYYSQARARSGAKQLAEYLEQNRSFSADKITIGYLVVFDGRRRKTSSIVSQLAASDANHYENREIQYDPDYSKIRSDFAAPLRFFLEPNSAKFK